MMMAVSVGMAKHPLFFIFSIRSVPHGGRRDHDCPAIVAGKSIILRSPLIGLGCLHCHFANRARLQRNLRRAHARRLRLLPELVHSGIQPSLAGGLNVKPGWRRDSPSLVVRFLRRRVTHLDRADRALAGQDTCVYRELRSQFEI